MLPKVHDINEALSDLLIVPRLKYSYKTMQPAPIDCSCFTIYSTRTVLFQICMSGVILLLAPFVLALRSSSIVFLSVSTTSCRFSTVASNVTTRCRRLWISCCMLSEFVVRFITEGVTARPVVEDSEDCLEMLFPISSLTGACFDNIVNPGSLIACLLLAPTGDPVLVPVAARGCFTPEEGPTGGDEGNGAFMATGDSTEDEAERTDGLLVGLL